MGFQVHCESPSGVSVQRCQTEFRMAAKEGGGSPEGLKCKVAPDTSLLELAFKVEFQHAICNPLGVGGNHFFLSVLLHKPCAGTLHKSHKIATQIAFNHRRSLASSYVISRTLR